jgi:hypothetical protein
MNPVFVAGFFVRYNIYSVDEESRSSELVEKSAGVARNSTKSMEGWYRSLKNP